MIDDDVRAFLRFMYAAQFRAHAISTSLHLIRMASHIVARPLPKSHNEDTRIPVPHEALRSIPSRLHSNAPRATSKSYIPSRRSSTTAAISLAITIASWTPALCSLANTGRFGCHLRWARRISYGSLVLENSALTLCLHARRCRGARQLASSHRRHGGCGIEVAVAGSEKILSQEVCH